MIQRKQTLYLFILAALNAVLLFVSNQHAMIGGVSYPIPLTPIRFQGISSTPGHIAAVYLNFAMLVLAFVAVFMYNRRTLQARLCYSIALLWVVLTAMIAFCPFVEATAEAVISLNYLVFAVGLAGIIVAILAARLIKKDIDLLKSVDRIR
jgi:hypothetical protein